MENDDGEYECPTVDNGGLGARCLEVGRGEAQGRCGVGPGGQLGLVGKRAGAMLEVRHTRSRGGRRLEEARGGRLAEEERERSAESGERRAVGNGRGARPAAGARLTRESAARW